MAFFKEAPIKSLTRDRDAAKANVDRLAGKLVEAEAATIATTQAAQRAALAGDDAALDIAETAEASALRRLSTISAANAEAAKLLTVLEEQIAETLDKTTRAATVAATNALADELIEAHTAYHASTSALNEVCARVLVVTQEANGLAVFLASSLIEVGAATPIVAEHLRLHARAVLNGQAKAEMPKPAPPAAKVVPVVKAPLVSVFATRALRWRDADGAERACAKYVDVELPAETAARALKVGAALKLDHPERKKNLNMWPGHVSLQNCFDLDAPEAAPQREPIQHSAFEPMPGLRKPYLMRIAT